VLKRDVFNESRILFILCVFALLLAVDIRSALRRIEFRFKTKDFAWAFCGCLVSGITFLSGARLKGFILFVWNLRIVSSLSRV
jgi:hypothetical protein